jgi:hypothetical protein
VLPSNRRTCSGKSPARAAISAVESAHPYGRNCGESGFTGRSYSGARLRNAQQIDPVCLALRKQ